AGRGEAGEFRAGLSPAMNSRVELLGQVSEQEKARMVRSVDVCCAPNTGQGSFGIILLEALAARTRIPATELGAFRRRLSRRWALRDGEVGRPSATGNPLALAAGLRTLLDDPQLRMRLASAGARAVEPFDWVVIAAQIMRVYELAIAGGSATEPRLR